MGKEAEEKVIDLPEDDPEMIRRLITYLYLGDYDPAISDSTCLLLPFLKHIIRVIAKARLAASASRPTTAHAWLPTPRI
jgi:hypothetical protein